MNEIQPEEVYGFFWQELKCFEIWREAHFCDVSDPAS